MEIKRDLAEHPLRISISTFSLFPLPVPAVMPLLRAAGLDGVELVAPPVVSRPAAERLAARIRSHGLEILSVHQTLLGAGPIVPLWRRAEDAVQLALAVGAPRVVLHAPHRPDRSGSASAHWLETLLRLQALAAKAGLTLSIENADRNPALDPPEVLGEMAALAEFAAAHGLGVTLDTCHAMRNGVDLLVGYELLRPRLVNVHLSDWRAIGAGERSLIRRSLMANHRLPGEGQAPLAPLLQRLAADGYAGPVTLEVNPWALQPWASDRCLRILQRAVAYIRQAEQGAAPEGA